MGLPLENHVMTPTEFLLWEEVQSEKHEFYAGEVFAMTGTRRCHVQVAGNVFSSLRAALRGTPCRAFIADMRVEVAENIFYPDILVTCNPDDLKADLVMQHPCVIVEVLSPLTAAFDRGNKFAAYRQIESLEEYVLIDPDLKLVEVYRRMPQGDWLLAASESASGLRLKSLDFQASPAEVFEDIE